MTTFPPGYTPTLTSLTDPASMLSPVARRRVILRRALRDNGPMGANEINGLFNVNCGDSGAESSMRALASLIEDGQVYQLASLTKHKRYALTASGSAHA